MPDQGEELKAQIKKLKLECEKLNLEIQQLKKVWWKRPAVMVPFSAALITATITFGTQWLTTKSKEETELKENLKNRLNIARTANTSKEILTKAGEKRKIKEDLRKALLFKNIK